MKTFRQIAEDYTIVEKANIDYDIKKRYKYFNKLLFNNELQDDFTMRFRRTKEAGGAVKHITYTKGSGKRKVVTRYEIQELYLSTFYLKTKEQLDSILVHEMIHVWMKQNDYHERYNVQSHGAEFVNKRNELQHKVKFDIPLVDNLSNEIRDKKEKNYGIVISKGPLGDSFVVFTENSYPKLKDELFELLTKHGNKKHRYLIGVCTAHELENYKMKRTANELQFYYMPDELKSSVEERFELWKAVEAKA